MVRTSAPAEPLAARRWRTRRWLVLAPHPDDETLGAGALIAQTCRSQTFAGLVFLTDGSGSHPATDGKARRLVAIRAREGALALSRLTGSRRWKPAHLGRKDAHPFNAGSVGFKCGVRAVFAL
ncbi:PIG-L deacetylase family protein, partial [Sphingobium sp.]|uniref:PIG-L deacetylase family protein n=1 Tax=Sphingobium sp. TaxID=1912891 RepID=UPI002C5B2C32